VAARSDAISLSVALKRPERSFGGATDSRASSFTEGSARNLHNGKIEDAIVCAVIQSTDVIKYRWM